MGGRAGRAVHALGRRLRTRRSPPAAVAGRPVGVDTDVGYLLFPAHDRLFVPILREQGCWEREESAVLRSHLRPGMTFVDVGAHVGYMTVLAARVVGPDGRGWAFEPAPGNAELLRGNLRRNGIDNVEVVEAAAWDTAGLVELSLSPWNSGDNRAYAVPEMERVGVRAVRVDDVLPPGAHVDVVKMDTQGTDHRAVRGMAATLARSRSVLLVEFWPAAITEQGEDPAGVVRQYLELGYDVRVLGDGEDGSAPAPEAVVSAAEASRDGYCTLLLRPPARGGGGG